MRRQKVKKEMDAQVREFERKDLGQDIARSRSAVVIKKKRQMPTSILLNPILVAKLEAKARKRGIGYQTMMKIIVAENISRY